MSYRNRFVNVNLRDNQNKCLGLGKTMSKLIKCVSICEDSLEEVSVWQKKFLWQAFEYRICIW